MTFELSDEHLAVRQRARALAQSLLPHAAKLDTGQALPADVRRDVVTLTSGDGIAAVIAVEEIAVALPAAAVSAGAGDTAGALNLSGLRGASTPDESPRAQLILAAVALGLGRAATEAALAEVRQAKSAAGAEDEKPQWVVADVATDLEAARLLTYKAAESMADADIAIARLMASGAAQRAVDAALRIGGPAALADGHIVERLARDVRAVSLLLGTEERHRAVAADTLLPQ